MTEDAHARPTTAPPTALQRILEAVDHLEQCRRAARVFGIVTGESVAEVRHAIDRFLLVAAPTLRVARVPAPTDSRQAFLQALLVQLGFEPVESTADDLMRLLTVILRQGLEPQRPICIVMDQAQEFGPHVFEALRELARAASNMTQPPLFLLSGNAALSRVLDSRGMASVAALTSQRFELQSVEPQAVHHEPADRGDGPSAQLVLSLGGEPLQHYALDGTRVLIGRGPHCDLCIRSRFVSRQHALLIRSSSGDWLVDLNSTNGTSVNSKVVQRSRLKHGDIVSIGNHRLQYLNPNGRWPQREHVHGADQLSETVIMRSLQTTRFDDAGVGPGSETSAA